MNDKCDLSFMLINDDDDDDDADVFSLWRDEKLDLILSQANIFYLNCVELSIKKLWLKIKIIIILIIKSGVLK